MTLRWQNLIYALEASLKSITEGPVSLEDRWRLHKQESKRFKDAAIALGFKQVPNHPDEAANGMTALYTPDGIAPGDIIGALAARDIVIAGGLHKDIKTKFVSFASSPSSCADVNAYRYIRFGHMGETAVLPERGDVSKMIAGLSSALAEVNSK